MTLDDSKIEEVQKHFQALSSVASSLNAASDALTKVVSTLDESLKKLNVGITAWVAFRIRADENVNPNDFDEDQIGYCKIRGTWGIALRHIWGNANWDDFNSEGPWPFNEGPREMRVLGVDEIPKLIKILSEKASETTKEVLEKTEEVRKLAGAIEQIANGQKTGSKLPPAPKWGKLDPAPADKLESTLKPLASPLQPVPQVFPTVSDPAREKKGGK